MRITNKFGLPNAFVEFAQEDYQVADGEYRATSLLKGIRETILLRRHHNEIEVDVSDMVWLLFGRAVHHILEQEKEKDTELKEERLKVEIGNYILSGQFDLYCGDTYKITDYKTASVWKIIYKNFEDWRKQLLIYAWMMRQYGFDVRAAEAVPFLKDHSKRDSKRKSDYPKLPVHPVEFKFDDQDFKDIEHWIFHRFEEIKAAELLPDDDLPLCTEEERFNKGDKFAVMGKKRKTAFRVLDSREQAEQWMADNKKGDFIEERRGEDVKCIDYCHANEFCNHYKLLKEEGIA